MRKIKYKNILIIQTAFLGDVILLTPLIRAVRELYPQAEIDALVVPQSQGVLDNNPHLREVLTFDKRQKKWRAFRQILRILSDRKYDLAISPHSSTTTALLMFLAGIPVRVGFDRWHAAHYLTHKVPHYDDRGWHKVQKNLHLLSALSGRSFNRQTELFPSLQDEAWAEQKLSVFSYPQKPLIALAPGSVWNTKRWPREHYIALSKKLCAEGYNLVFIGGTDERGLCQEIIEQSGCRALNTAGEASILQSAALIGRCELMICNDSGALHIANAMQTDVFAFFGPTVPAIGYYPFRPGDVVFERRMDCRPCGAHGGKTCPLQHHECMTLITPVEVFKKVKERITLHK